MRRRFTIVALAVASAFAIAAPAMASISWMS